MNAGDRGQGTGARVACADVEILLADYLDQTLRAEEKARVESHLSACAACAELARDARGAVAFMERAAEVEAPPELVTRLLYEISSGPSHAVVKPGLVRRIFGKLFGKFEHILRPRLVMGMAMTMLSFAMLFRFANVPVRQLNPSDLDPVKVWAAAEDRVVRMWERGKKYYENLRVVYEIQTRLKEWNEEPAAAAPQNGTGAGSNEKKAQPGGSK